MEVLTAAGAGYLLAVLWFDLMFDVQVRHDPVDPAALRGIAAYYRRVTTDARPMNRLVALAMLVTLVSIVVQVVTVGTADTPWWSALALPLALGPIVLAGVRTVPSAVRLGQTTEAGPEELTLAKRILADHLLCIAGIAGVLVVQVLLAVAS
jgi:hypothetical protein